MDIAKDHMISRCIIYSKFFPGNIHTDEILFKFGKSKDDGRAHESAVLRELAPQDDDVHRIGCSIAEKQNIAKEKPPPGPARKYYCGFRTAKAEAMQLATDGYRITLANIPEDGEAAHVDVALELLVQGTNKRSTWRTAAGMALAEAFGEPTPYRCACDLDDDQHPFSKFGLECLSSGLRNRWPNLVLALPKSSTDLKS